MILRALLAGLPEGMALDYGFPEIPVLQQLFDLFAALFRTAVAGPGTWVIFGVILVPIYVMIVAWFVGEPGDVRRSVMGVTYVVGITVLLWLGLFITTVVIGAIFYELPGLHNIGN